MNKRMSIVVLVTAIGTSIVLFASCSNQPSGNTSNNNSTTKTSPPSDKGDQVVTGGDLSFIMAAATGHMAEVELGRLATERAASKDVKQFGQRMVTDHTRVGQELMQLAKQKKVTPPEITPKQKESMAKLSKLSGAEFDRAYVMDMVEDHMKDVAAFEATAQNATDQDVKDYASKTLPMLREHLQMIRDIAGKMNVKSK